MEFTHIKNRIFHFALAAQHKQCCEVARLHNSKVSGVVCLKSATTHLPATALQLLCEKLRTLHDVVGPRAIRTRLTRESNLEHTSSAIRRVRRRSSTKNIHGLALSLASVVHGDGAFVLLVSVSSILLAHQSFLKKPCLCTMDSH
jgi:hypothetical protein